MPRTLFIHAQLATMGGLSGYGLVDDGAMLVDGERIKWIKPTDQVKAVAGADIVDCKGRLVTPGLIDCHTHLVYGGDRADEFEMRLEGASYEEIARKGGGILSTVDATRKASEADLLAQAAIRIETLLSEGVTTLEIKSGYGLDSETEIKMLRVAQRLGEIYRVRIEKTFLAAHALPAEFEGRGDDYIRQVCDDMLPRAMAAGLVDAVDVFIESIGFSVAQAERVFDAAKAMSLPIKAHVEQLSDLGGTVMAASRSALSVDHIEYLKDADVAQLSKSGTVAVLLPAAFYVLRETQLPPIDALRKHKIAIAIATDCNPGSSPVTSILLIMNMACTLFRLTPAEALRGVSINAAKALGLDSDIGSLEAGKQADLVIWDNERPSQLSYQIGNNACSSVMQAGTWRKQPATGTVL